jgi:reactive intermediate/imine deaminase
MEQISTDSPDSELPFSEAIRHGDTIYVSGQGPIDPESGEIVGETPGEQTARTLENIDRILKAGGSSLDNVVKANVYLTDMSNYDKINEVYGDYVTHPSPARTAVEVADLPVDIYVEITVVAAATTSSP